MISRHWKGVTRPGQAAGYIDHLRRETFPGLAVIPLLRNDRRSDAVPTAERRRSNCAVTTHYRAGRCLRAMTTVAVISVSNAKTASPHSETAGTQQGPQ